MKQHWPFLAQSPGPRSRASLWHREQSPAQLWWWSCSLILLGSSGGLCRPDPDEEWHGAGHSLRRWAQCDWPHLRNPSRCLGSSLDSHIHGRCVGSLEHDLSLLLVDLGAEGCLGEGDGMLIQCQAEPVVESMVPDLLRMVPVGDHSVLSGILQGHDASLALGLIPHVAVLLAYAYHDPVVPGCPTMENTARGASSPPKPALHIPDPLSTTKADSSSSVIVLARIFQMREQKLNIE